MCVTPSATSSPSSSSAVAPTSPSRPCAGWSGGGRGRWCSPRTIPTCSTTRAPSSSRPARPTVEVVGFDAEATDGHAALVDDLFDRFGDFDVVLVDVRGARRPIRSRGRCRGRPRDRAHQLLGHDLGRGTGRPAAHAAGPRHDRGTVVGRRRARSSLQLRVRLVEGGDGRVPPGPRRQPRRHRRARHGRAPGIRALEDDRGPRRRRRCRPRPTRWPTRSSPASRGAARPCGFPARSVT